MRSGVSPPPVLLADRTPGASVAGFLRAVLDGDRSGVSRYLHGIGFDPGWADGRGVDSWVQARAAVQADPAGWRGADLVCEQSPLTTAASGPAQDCVPTTAPVVDPTTARHADLVPPAVRAGLAVFVEKSLVDNAADTRALAVPIAASVPCSPPGRWASSAAHMPGSRTPGCPTAPSPGPRHGRVSVFRARPSLKIEFRDALSQRG